MHQLRIIFMGTPEFAVPTLKTLVEAGKNVVAVITATDKMGGRGRKEKLESAVKKYAVENGLPVLQPKNLKSHEFQSELASYNADLQVVVAFRMLPESVWNMPVHGTVNLHASLLPKYRGAAPINWAIIHGEKYTGLTTFRLKHEIDTGSIIFQEEVKIGQNETAGELHDRMKIIGAGLVLKTVDAIESGKATFKEQPNTGITKAPKIYKETCEINFEQNVQKVHDFIRGLSPHPGAWTYIDNIFTKILRAEISTDEYLEPGALEVKDNSLFIGTKTKALEVIEIQPEGKRRMSTKDYLNGHTIQNMSVGLDFRRDA
jgi:methionyl-tRNA formyltransferase